MTTFAMSGGMIPAAAGWGVDGTLRQGMGAAVIGGLVLSTLLSLVFVPAMFVLVDRLERLVKPAFGRLTTRGQSPVRGRVLRLKYGLLTIDCRLSVRLDGIGASLSVAMRESHAGVEREAQHRGREEERQPSPMARPPLEPAAGENQDRRQDQNPDLVRVQICVRILKEALHGRQANRGARPGGEQRQHSRRATTENMTAHHGGVGRVRLAGGRGRSSRRCVML
jgi:hypothetical protein